MLSVGLAVGTASWAQVVPWPGKPIRILVGFPPGGLTDAYARSYGDHLSQRLGVPVVVENKPGAGAMLAIDQVAKSAPDGHTLLVSTLRGVGLTPGYFRDPEITAQVMKPGGWYASGDLGRQDADGALHVMGRLKEMIIRSGFNVYPGEVEAVLLSFPGVQKAAVAGRKAADGNEDILAFVEARPGTQLDEAALRAHAHERLAPYKRPSVLQIVPEMPMTHSGKILKRELVARLERSA